MLSELLAQRNIPVPPSLQNHGACVLRRLGSREGLLCQGGPPDIERTGHSVASMEILALEGKSVKRVFAFPVQARALDFPEAIYATLKVEYDEAKGVLTLDDGAFGCEKATSSGDESLEYQRVVNRVCNARGVYELRGSAFVKKASPPRIKWPGGPRRSAMPPPGSSF